MTPDISIVIPAFNVEPYIRQALDAALGQRGVEHEVIVVDDGSTDGTPAILSAYEGHPRLTVIRQGNTGPSISRNAALAVARGRHIGFLDGDDIWEADKARKHVDHLDANPGLDLSYSWWRVIDESGAPTGRINVEPLERLPAGMGFEGLIAENFTGTMSTVVIRGDALRAVGGLDPELRSNVDLDLLLRVALLRDGNVGLVPEVLTSYRIHATQITSDWRRMATNWEKVVQKARGLAPERVDRILPLARARVGRYLAYIAYIRGDHASARRLIARSWLDAPASLARDRRAWLTTLAIGATLLPRAIHDPVVGALKRRRSARASRALASRGFVPPRRAAAEGEVR